MEQNQAATGGKYRKKPIVIEAFQMTRERRADNGDWPNWLHDAWSKAHNEEGALFPKNHPDSDGTDELCIYTKEGLHLVTFGDWIIQGVQGELYPCKPDIFDATYQLAGDDEAPADPNPPHAFIALRLENQGMTIEVRNNVSTMTEPLHFANWIGQNLDALVLLARQDWHLRNEMNRLLLQQQAQELQQQAEGGEQPAIETGRPRLVSANGGPLQ
jgi:hypothetical protein